MDQDALACRSHAESAARPVSAQLEIVRRRIRRPPEDVRSRTSSGSNWYSCPRSGWWGRGAGFQHPLIKMSSCEGRVQVRRDGRFLAPLSATVLQVLNAHKDRSSSRKFTKASSVGPCPVPCSRGKGGKTLCPAVIWPWADILSYEFACTFFRTTSFKGFASCAFCFDLRPVASNLASLDLSVAYVDYSSSLRLSNCKQYSMDSHQKVRRRPKRG